MTPRRPGPGLALFRALVEAVGVMNYDCTQILVSFERRPHGPDGAGSCLRHPRFRRRVCSICAGASSGS